MFFAFLLSLAIPFTIGGLSTTDTFSFRENTFSISQNNTLEEGRIKINAVHPLEQKEVCSLFTTQSEDIPSQFSVPWNVFSAAKEVFLQVFCSTEGVELSFDMGENGILWSEVLYMEDGKNWEKLPLLTGTQAFPNTKWLSDAEKTLLPISLKNASEELYIAAYACFWEQGAWKCGCHNMETCTSSGDWTLQKIKIPNVLLKNEKKQEEEKRENDNDVLENEGRKNFQIFDVTTEQNQPILDARFLQNMSIIYHVSIADSETDALPTEASLKKAVQANSTMKYIVFDLYEGRVNKNMTNAAINAELAKFNQIISWAREVAQPEQKFGIYGEVPITERFAYGNPTELKRLQELNTILFNGYIGDFYVPDLYTMGGWDLNDASGASATEQALNGVLDECGRVKAETPCYPIIWYRYNVGGPLYGTDLTAAQFRKYQLDLAFNHKDADGVLVWSSEYTQNWLSPNPWWYDSIVQFLNDKKKKEEKEDDRGTLEKDNKDFQIFDMTLYKEKPVDLSARGFPKMNIAYEHPFYDNRPKDFPREALPTDEAIRRVARDAAAVSNFLNIDIERWALPNEVEKYVHVLDIMKDEEPNLDIGFYVGPPKRDYWRAIKGEGSPEYKQWQEENDNLKILTDKVDVLLPNAYTFYDDREGWVAYAKAQITEAKRLAPDKPAYLTLWPQYHDSNKTLKGQYIPHDFFRLQLETAYKYADGVVIWGGKDIVGGTGRLPWNENSSWWKEVEDFLNKEEEKEVKQEQKDSSYTTPINLPSCDSNGSFIIDSNDDWGQINNPQYTNFCVKPGNYRSAGTITLTSSGTAAQKRTIQLMIENDVHPAKLAQNKQAFLHGLIFGNGTQTANHWVVDRMSFVDINEPHITGIKEGSSDNIISRWRYENNNSGIDIQDHADRNIIQNSYIGDTTIEAVNNDFVCIGLQAYAYGSRQNVVITDTKIVGNELFNCNDAIQLIRNGEDRNGSFPGTLIADNDIYVRDNRLTDCNGNIQKNGPCMIGENALDIKGGSDDAANPVRVLANRMWNIRQSDRNLVPTGSWGDAVIMHYSTKNLIFKDNIIFNSSRGAVVHLGASNINVDNNIFYGINFPQDNVGQALMFTSEAGTNNIGRRNIIIDARSAIENGNGATLECNVIADSTKYDEYCFDIKRISGPEKICLKGARVPARGKNACLGAVTR